MTLAPRSTLWLLAALSLGPSCGGPDLPPIGPDAGTDAAGLDASTPRDGGGTACTTARDCDDGLFCNGAETCEAGACAAGTPPVSDDGVDCTADSCDEAANAVLHTPSDAACDDGAFCDGPERCTSTGCVEGTPPTLDDGVPCTVDGCDEALDRIVHTPNDGTCDDADACTADRCNAGLGCEHPVVCSCRAASECDDGNACTDDACTGGACVYTNNDASCDDGAHCNGADVCAGGTCVHAGDPCAGGGDCASTCDEAADGCLAPAGSSCTSDGNPCTEDVCDGAGTCLHPGNTDPCNDGLYCNGADVCSGGVCGHAGDPCASGADCNRTCNEATDSCRAPAGTACTSDSNPCTTDTCSAAGACTHANNTLACDDGLYCNGTDRCSAGACSVHASPPCTGGAECASTCDEAADSCFAPAGAPCTDTSPTDCTRPGCSGTGTCDQAYLTIAAGGGCNDGLYCNGADTCDASAACTGHAGDPCPGDVCLESADACMASTHRIFMSSGTASLGSGDNVAFQMANNDFCQAAAAAAGLPGTWLGVYSTGFIRTASGLPLTLRGPVLNFDGGVVWGPGRSFTGPITTDERGVALPPGATAWTSECAFDFLIGGNAANFGSTTNLAVMKVACSGSRRRICISQ